MTRPVWMDRPHEFREDVDDYSMCVCGVPADVHHLSADLDHRAGGTL